MTVAACADTKSGYAKPICTGSRSGQPIRESTPDAAERLWPQVRYIRYGPSDPNAGSVTCTRSGLSTRRSSYRRRSSVRARSLMFVITTSTAATIRSNTARPSSESISRPTLRFSADEKFSAGSVSRRTDASTFGGSQPAPPRRSESGRRSDSTRTTSAPNCARLRAATGAAMP